MCVLTLNITCTARNPACGMSASNDAVSVQLNDYEHIGGINYDTICHNTVHVVSHVRVCSNVIMPGGIFQIT